MALQGGREEKLPIPGRRLRRPECQQASPGGSCPMREAPSLMRHGGHACLSQLRCRPCCLAMALLISFRAPLLGHFGRLRTSLQDEAWTR